LEENQEVPFFAGLLESQRFPKVKTDLKAGPGNRGRQTLKYPSDDDPGLP
jgi:hypothetical protein